MDDILTHVQSALAPSAPSIETNGGNASSGAFFDKTFRQETSVFAEDFYHDETVFDDVGEGAGVEGDLDMEDD